MPLAPKSKVDPKKAESDRLQAFLHEMLREEENKYCADCEAKQPRWASWNLGVFLCIRCAGLHRNLGVHISKIKSVNLDSWTPEQVQSVRVMGNAKAKAVYEAELPSAFRRPQSDHALEGFIRAKYEQKRYLLRDWRPPRVDVSDLPASAAADRKAAAVPTRTGHPPPMSPKREAAGGQPQQGLLVDLFSSPEHSTSNQASSVTAGSDNSSNVLSSSLDEFGPIVSAPMAGQSEGGLRPSVSFTPGLTTSTKTGGGASTGLDEVDLFGFGAPAPNPTVAKGDSLDGVDFGGKQETKKTTSDIMALFNTAPPLQQPPPLSGLGNFQQQPACPATQHPMPIPTATTLNTNYSNVAQTIPAFANFGVQPAAMTSPPIPAGFSAPQPFQQQSFFPAMASTTTSAQMATPMALGKSTQGMSGLDDLLADFKM